MINWRFKSLYCARNLEFNIDINRKLRFGLVWKEEVNDHEDQQICNNEALMKTQFLEDNSLRYRYSIDAFKGATNVDLRLVDYVFWAGITTDFKFGFHVSYTLNRRPHLMQISALWMVMSWEQGVPEMSTPWLLCLRHALIL
jgi:hypothetical protein